MAKVKYFTKVQRAPFRKLATGKMYYLDSDGTGPFVKCGPRAKLVANTFPANNGGTAISDVSVVTKKVGKAYVGQQVI